MLLHQSQEAAFFKEVKTVMKRFYPGGQASSDSYGRIINQTHWDRLANMLEDHKGELVLGGLGEAKRETKYFPTTIVKNPSLDSRLMAEEVFGPLLSVITVPSVDRAIEIVNSKDKPLALYIFTTEQATVDDVLARTSSGGVSVNDALVHVANPHLPFGGIGESGLGCYHGKAGFDEFSHLRSVYQRPLSSGLDLIASARYPPYSKESHQSLKKMTLQGGPLSPTAIFALKCLAVLALAWGVHASGLMSRL